MSEFFDQLQVFSDRFVKSELHLNSSISPWGRSAYKEKEPRGAIIHFTAEEDFLTNVRWFVKESLNARASAHVVVADRQLASHAKLAEDLPLIKKLPTTVVQCRKPDTVAWHATWTNSYCYGIENACAGELRKTEKGFAYWPNDWTRPWSVPYKTPVHALGRYWSPYTEAQVATNIEILRELLAMYPTLRSDWILGHENVQKGKRDPSVVFPLARVRDAVFSNTPIHDLHWLSHFGSDPRFYEVELDGMVIYWVKGLSAEPLSRDPSPKAAWTRFESAFRALPNEMDEDTFAVGLSLLGYAGASRASVEIFQKMMGLRVDAIVGTATCEALIDRVVDRGFFKEEGGVA